MLTAETIGRHRSRAALLDARRSNRHLAVPHGDMMLAGCFGLLRAMAARLPEFAPVVESATEPVGAAALSETSRSRAPSLLQHGLSCGRGPGPSSPAPVTRSRCWPYRGRHSWTSDVARELILRFLAGDDAIAAFVGGC